MTPPFEEWDVAKGDRASPHWLYVRSRCSNYWLLLLLFVVVVVVVVVGGGGVVILLLLASD